jgi:Membrane-fusion protein
LPGTFQAFNQTTIFPRSNGYVESWKVDIGDYVQAGQLLAEIATPEVDQQLAQARAQEEIAKLTADRWRDLLDKKVVSKQEYDQNEKAYEARKRIYSSSKNSGFPANPRAVCWKDRCSKYRCWHARDRRDRKFRHTAFQPRAE